MDISAKLAEELNIKKSQAEATIKLIDEGNTIPFIARYRKEVTGALNDEILRNLYERLTYLRNLEDKKQSVLGSIEEQGKLTEELKARIEAAETLVVLEDLYRPYKQKRKTRASVAKEKGLEPLAAYILEQNAAAPLTETAQAYVDAEKGVADAKEAIDGAKDIIAEQISDEADYRIYIRNLTFEEGKIVSTAKDEKVQSVYENYYAYEEPIKKVVGHRILALNRGEKEKMLIVKIEAPTDRILRYLEISNMMIMLLVVICGMFLLIMATREMFLPLTNMAETAQLVGQGNFNVKMPPADSRDELGTVTRAFNTMVDNLGLYIARTKASMEKEQQMIERELLMETHLKEAQLKYLQSQINPHFLFNSLNAGVQLAMMEDAEKTSIFVEKMADFFRYNVKKGEEDATLEEELEAVDNYIYILNVRFAGDIHFSKKVECDVENVRVPSMILQPVVENAVNHGIRNIDWEGHIDLSVEKWNDHIEISVRDNGLGMTGEQIQRVLSKKVHSSSGEGDSTGIGMNNVISRLELYYERDGLMEIYSEGEGMGTEVVINIPLERSEKNVQNPDC